MRASRNAAPVPEQGEEISKYWGEWAWRTQGRSRRMQTIQCFRCGSSRNRIAAVLLYGQEAGIKADLE